MESVILSRAPGSTEQGRKVLACLVTRAGDGGREAACRDGGRQAACRDTILQLLQGEQVTRHYSCALYSWVVPKIQGKCLN